MTDAERGRELNRLIRLERKLKKAHPAIRAKVEHRLNQLFNETAQRFLKVYGPNSWVVKDLIGHAATGGSSAGASGGGE